MQKRHRGDLTGKAKELRNEPTEAERILWSRLKQSKMSDYKFRRQQPVGSYIVDFVCFSKSLIVELDGGQHHDQKVWDIRRDAWLKSEGFTVLRFWNNDVTENLESIASVIIDELKKEG